MGEPGKQGLEAPKPASLWMKGETWGCSWASKGSSHLKREEAAPEPQGTKGPACGSGGTAPPVCTLSPVPWHLEQQPFPEHCSAMDPE